MAPDPCNPHRARDWRDLSGRIIDGVHVLPVRVYYEDTDFSGVVYHTGYLRFCERGRSDLLRLAGIHHSLLLAGQEGGEPLSFAVRHMEIDFLNAARIDDVLEVHTSLAGSGGARMILDQAVVRDGSDLVRIKVTVAIIGRGGRPRRLPARVRTSLLALLGS